MESSDSLTETTSSGDFGIGEGKKIKNSMFEVLGSAATLGVGAQIARYKVAWPVPCYSNRPGPSKVPCILLLPHWRCFYIHIHSY